MYRIGIDPGVSGAIAVLNESDACLGLWDMPLLTTPGGKNKVNCAELARVIIQIPRSFFIQSSTIIAYLEQVSAMPKQGVVSMFNFGMSYGAVQGVLAALAIPMVLVTPGSWKKRAGLTGQDKDYARTLAQQLWPAQPLGRKKDIGRADALLIAKFGHHEVKE